MKNLTLLFSSLLILAGCGAQEEETPKPVVEVKVAKAEAADVKITVRAPASVFAREQANISARITAPIRKLLVRKGDNVAAGQVLAQLDNRDLLAQRDEAAAAVTDAQANLQRVTSGTLPTDIERARGQLASRRSGTELRPKSSTTGAGNFSSRARFRSATCWSQRDRTGAGQSELRSREEIARPASESIRATRTS